jgi:threonine dehydrogenase-like Zn-dependent dehydrogenase
MAAAGPMGLGAIDFALHGPRQPKRLLVTDIAAERLARAKSMFPPDRAAQAGVELTFLNPTQLEGGTEALIPYARQLTAGEMFDDAFIFYPDEGLIVQADALLARNGCLNFFAGPPRRDFSAGLNFYNVHYEGHHIVGTSGGNTEDLRISLELMSEGRVNPAGMVTHVGGLDAAAPTILDLPNIPGGKKLIYTQVRMPLTPIDQLGPRGDAAGEPLRSVFSELGGLVEAANGVWCTAAERFLLSCEELRWPED